MHGETAVPSIMENMIKRIVEMDEKARQITEEAQRARSGSAEAIAQKREELRAEYLDKARARIERNRQTEQAAADVEWQEIEKKYQALGAGLDKKFEAHHGEWAEAIFRRVIGG